MLIEDSDRLQQTYPGDNATEIEQLQATVVENWGVLQDRAAERKEELIAASELHRFSADVSLTIPIVDSVMLMKMSLDDFTFCQHNNVRKGWINVNVNC